MSRILVVEDDPTVRTMLRAIFESAGYEVTEAGHGRAALDLMRGDDLPDVVTTDLMMPVMGGNEFIHILRSEPRTAAIPILVVSANAGAAEGLRAAEGADAVISKPFISANLVKLVQYLNGAAPPSRVAGEELTMERLSTGIPPLDTILGGGLPVGSLTVLAGLPGTGKTILAQQMCFSNATRERRAVYYSTISEPPGKFIANLETFEFFDRDALVDRVEFINLGELLQSDESDGLGSMMDEIVRKCVEEHPVLVVVDSAKALRDFSPSERGLRTAIYKLAARIAHTDTAVIFVGEYGPDEIASAPEFSLADGIIEMVYEPHQPMDRRWLRVRKLRSSKPLSGQHPVQISEAGITLYVRAETLNGHLQSVAEPQGRIAIGVPGLDEMCHGGLPRGGSTLVLGPSGCGKTGLALRFLVQGLEDGERCLYVTFQENPAQLIRKAASFGWELRPFLESGLLVIYHVPESALDLDVVASVVRKHLADAPLQRMVIDSLAEMVVAARESERFSAYARTLLGLLRAAGVSVLTTSETSSLGPMTEPVGGLSFLYHNVLLLRYIEQNSEVGRAVAILKMRNSAHEKGLWKFMITDHGFQILEKLEGVTGLLGWTVLSDTPSRQPAPAPL